MEHIIDYFSVETEPRDDFDKFGSPILKPGMRTLMLKNKHGDILFHGRALTMEELLARLPHSLRQEIADRGLEGIKESAEERLARTAQDFEQALSEFPPELIQVNVYDSRDRFDTSQRLDDQIKPPQYRVEIWRKAPTKVYP